MKTQAFVFSWKGHEARAADLEAAISRLLPVTVINSGRGGDQWIELGDQAYFSAQWNRALELFDADVLFHIQADARFDDFERLLARATSLLAGGEVGVLEPNVDFTDLDYDPFRLTAIDGEAREVPMTDQTCWFVTCEVLRRLPPVDLSVNRYGWGISAAVAAVSHLMGKRCARDYGFSVSHPRRRGYSAEVALQERYAYLRSLGPEISSQAARLYEWRFRVLREPPEPDAPSRSSVVQNL